MSENSKKKKSLSEKIKENEETIIMGMVWTGIIAMTGLVAALSYKAMQAEQQHMLRLGETHERGAYQGSLSQIKRLLRLRPRQCVELRLPLRLKHLPQLDDWEREEHRRSDDLAWQTFDVRKCRAQDFVAPDDFLQTLLQGCHIERAA